MFPHMKTQADNLALAKSWFVFDCVLFMDINFHKLKLTRGSFYLPLPDWISGKKAVSNPNSRKDEECFKWAILAALHHENIDSHPERISKLRRFKGDYDWRGLEFPIALDKIKKLQQANHPKQWHMDTRKPWMSSKPESFGSLGDFHPTPKMDDLKAISHKKFNAFIKGRGSKGRNNYGSKNLKAMFDFNSLKADRKALVVSLEDMEPTKFHSMREVARTISIKEGVIRYVRNNERDFFKIQGQKHQGIFHKVVLICHK